MAIPRDQLETILFDDNTLQEILPSQAPKRSWSASIASDLISRPTNAQVEHDTLVRLTKEQHAVLEQHFCLQPKPSTSTKKELASELNVPLLKVTNWFQNRRAKVKQDAKAKARSSWPSLSPDALRGSDVCLLPKPYFGNSQISFAPPPSSDIPMGQRPSPTGSTGSTLDSGYKSGNDSKRMQSPDTRITLTPSNDVFFDKNGRLIAVPEFPSYQRLPESTTRSSSSGSDGPVRFYSGLWSPAVNHVADRSSIEQSSAPSSATPLSSVSSDRSSSAAAEDVTRLVFPPVRTAKQIIITYILGHVRAWIQDILRTKAQLCNDAGTADNNESGAENAGCASGYGSESHPTNSQNSAGKRRRDDNVQDDSDHELGGSKKRQNPQKRDLRSVAEVPELSFACHYYRRRPHMYRDSSWKSCMGPGWKEVHRVKEHLLKCHKLRPRCPRCGESFDSQSRVDSHLQEVVACPKKRVAPAEGITVDMETQLKDRRGLSKMTAHEKWTHWYRILFPNDDPLLAPSPYYEHPAPSYSAQDDYLRYEFIQEVETELELNLNEQLPTLMPQLRDVLRTTLQSVYRRRLQVAEAAAIFGEDQPDLLDGINWETVFDLPLDELPGLPTEQYGNRDPLGVHPNDQLTRDSGDYEARQTQYIPDFGEWAFLDQVRSVRDPQQATFEAENHEQRHGFNFDNCQPG